MKTPSHRQWRTLFALWSIQGLLVFFWLLAIPTDTDHPVAFGLSLARLALVGTALLLTVLSVLLWVLHPVLFRQPIWLKIERQPLFLDLVYVFSLLVLAGVLVIFYDFSLLPDEAVYVSTLTRLRPILLWFGFSALELAIVIIWNRYEQVKVDWGTFKGTFRNVLLLMAALGLLGVWIARTGIGITPEDNWGGPAVPFLGWQILLALSVVGICVFMPSLSSRKILKWLPLGIYLFTVILWLSQPVNPAFTATPPRAPNFEIYPFSDPQFYAQYAQSALAGQGFVWPDVPARPFYVAFLTWLHLLGNQNYNHVIVLQTLVLALLPVLLYLVGREIGGWPLGLSLAILTAFRDLNANGSAPFGNNITYSKLLLSELPAALLISLATLLTIRWLRSTNRPGWYPLLLGGILGAATLIRLQSFVLLAVIILLAVIAIRERRQLLVGVVLLLAGFVITLTPWILRNYHATGGLVLDNPISQTMTMARRWSGSTGNEEIPHLSGENEAQYSSRLMGMALNSFRQNPGFILRTAANHFVNSEIGSLLAFPLRDSLLSPSELLWPQHPFWKTPVTAGQMPLFVFYLFLFALGVIAAWQHQRWIGLLPLALGLAYNFLSAVFFSSGARFIVPVDWSMQLYQLFGLLILGGLLLLFAETVREKISIWLRQPVEEMTAAPASLRDTKRGFVLSLVAVLLLSAFLPVTESVFPNRYPPLVQEAIIQRMGAQLEPGEIALYGRAIYPRYYKSGDGEPGTAKLGYEPSEQARLVFYLVGPTDQLVIFNLKDAPGFFPNASDVYMVGTQMDRYFSPRIVMVTKNGHTEFYPDR
jgi:hypothetical protein